MTTTTTTTTATSIHCDIEKDNNDMLSPPLTPKEDHHSASTPPIVDSNHHRKSFIHAYAQMVPHLRPVDSRMYGKKSSTCSSPSACCMDWPISPHHHHHHEDLPHHQQLQQQPQQVFTFDLCKLFPPLRPKRKYQHLKDEDDEDLFSEEEEEEQAVVPDHEIMVKKEQSSDAESSSCSIVSSSYPSSHSSSKKSSSPLHVSRKKIKTAKKNNSEQHENNNNNGRRRSYQTNSSSSSSPRRNHRDLSIKGFQIEPQYLFDNIDIDIKDQDFYPQDWLPLTHRLDQVPVDINWKGKPLKLDIHDPYFHRLHTIETDVISHMRLSPQLYLRCKRAIIMAAREFSLHGLEFRKSDAQKVCRIDVNKSSRLWAAFNAYGWLKQQ